MNQQFAHGAKMAITAVIFDAFGTTLRIGCRTNPYRQMLREGAKQGRRPHPDDLHHVMTHDVGLREAADSLGIKVAPERMLEFEAALQREIDSIEVFPDALEAIGLFQDHGIAIAVCSNLAAPYGPAVKALLPNHTAYALSYELGLTKPEPGIYRAACHELGISPGRLFENVPQVAMIGDSRRYDRDGPRLIGIRGFHLDRTGPGAIRDLRQFADLVVNAPGNRR